MATALLWTSDYIAGLCVERIPWRVGQADRLMDLGLVPGLSSMPDRDHGAR
jgi:hypothetical protein